LLPGGANQFPGGLLPLWTTAFSRRTRLRDYTGKWTETVAIPHNGTPDPDYFRLARDSQQRVSVEPVRSSNECIGEFESTEEAFCRPDFKVTTWALCTDQWEWCTQTSLKVGHAPVSSEIYGGFRRLIQAEKRQQELVYRYLVSRENN
jgi:hypothetical protein